MITLKNSFLFLYLSIISLNYSCLNSKNMSTESSPIEFTEERRLNHAIDLKEITLINNMEELTNLYAKLNDPNIPRSAPIPVFDENSEMILVIKPKLETIVNGDIEIESVTQLNSKIMVNYKEIENWEYKENKSTHPIVIIRISEKSSEIKLNKIN